MACERLEHPRAAEVRDQLALLQAIPEQIPRQLDSNAWWAGAGSLAAETMADNPGLTEAVWRMPIREFRALLIAICDRLLARWCRQADALANFCSASALPANL